MGSKGTTHILYHFDYSICSVMVRYSLALRGDPKDAAHEIRVREEPINIMKGEQLTEHYLCDVNSRGEVPVLAAVNSNNTIPDSVEITKYLAKSYPALIPDSHACEINELLVGLHGISFFAFTYSGKPQKQQATKRLLTDRLEENISEKYREAIKVKLQRINDVKISHLESDYQQKNEDYTARFVKKLDGLLSGSTTGYFFSLKEPSALDAHVTVFVDRMTDIGREDVLSEGLKQYGAKAFDTPAWKETTQGRKSMPPKA